MADDFELSVLSVFNRLFVCMTKELDYFICIHKYFM